MISKNDSIDYDNLTYSDIFSAIKTVDINMRDDENLLKYQLQNKKKAKYEMGNFCEQYGLSPIAPSKKKGKKHDKSHKSYSHKKYEKYKNNFVKPGKLKNEFNMLNIDNKDQEELFKILEPNASKSNT